MGLRECLQLPVVSNAKHQLTSGFWSALCNQDRRRPMHGIVARREARPAIGVTRHSRWIGKMHRKLAQDAFLP